MSELESRLEDYLNREESIEPISCPACKGMGDLGGHPCDVCGQTGWVEAIEQLGESDHE